MLDYFREGGWGMYPIFILGAFALVLAIRYAFDESINSGTGRERLPAWVDLR